MVGVVAQCDWQINSGANAGFQAVYFSSSNSSSGIVGVDSGEGITYVPAYAAIWMRYAPPPAPPLVVVLQASHDAFNQTEFQLAIAETTGRTMPPLQ